MSLENCRAGALPTELHPHADLRFCAASRLMHGSTAIQQHHNSSARLDRVGGGIGTADRCGRPYGANTLISPHTHRLSTGCGQVSSLSLGNCSSTGLASLTRLRAGQAPVSRPVRARRIVPTHDECAGVDGVGCPRRPSAWRWPPRSWSVRGTPGPAGVGSDPLAVHVT
jgi:hypothetical protein